MAKYYDLNTFVQEYLVSSKPELKDLTSRLENVPISLRKFEDVMKRQYNEDLSSLIVRAELISPQMRLLLLDDLTNTIDEADRITGRIALPYASISVSGEAISRNFYEKTKHFFGSLIMPDTSDPSAKVLSRRGVPGVAVMFNNPEKRHGRLDYIEIALAKHLG